MAVSHSRFSRGAIAKGVKDFYVSPLSRFAYHQKQKKSYLAAIFAFLLISLVTFSQASVFTYIRGAVLGVVSSFHYYGEKFTYPIRRIATTIVSYQNLFDQMSQLKYQNETLVKWKNKAEILLEENRQLKKHLNVLDKKAEIVMTTRISYSKDGQSIFINSYESKILQKNQVIVDEKGLIGRIISVDGPVAKIVPLINPMSRIPVVSGNGLHAIMQGQGKDLLKLSYFDQHKKPKIGDQFYTSSYGGVFPFGLYVGIVSQIDEQGNVFVKPSYKLNELNYVSVLPSVSGTEEE